MLYFSKLFLCLLQVGYALFEFRTKDLRTLVESGVLDGNGRRNRESREVWQGANVAVQSFAPIIAHVQSSVFSPLLCPHFAS
jgi:hypothetical protein